MSHLLEDTLERIARTISRRAGITIVCRGNEAKTNGKEIILPSLPTPCSSQLERFWHGCLDHEVGHVLHSDFGVIEQFWKKQGSKGSLLLNALEDIRIETMMEAEYPGSIENLAHANREAFRLWAEKVNDTTLWDRVLAAIIATGRGFDTNIFGKEAMMLVKPVEDLIHRVPRCQSTEEVATIANKIIRRWRKLMKKLQNKNNRAANDRHNSKETQDLAEKLGELFQGSPSDNTYSLGQALQQAIVEQMAGDSNQPYRVYDRSQDVVMTASDADPKIYQGILEEVRPLVSGLRQKLIMTLRGKSQSRYVPDENGSKLNRKRLHTVCLGLSSSPFMTKAESPSTDVAVSLLIDQSGSMRGERMKLARQCAVLLAETMNQLPLPLEILGFTTTHDHSYVAELRKREEQSIVDIERQFTRYQ